MVREEGGCRPAACVAGAVSAAGQSRASGSFSKVGHVVRGYSSIGLYHDWDHFGALSQGVCVLPFDVWCMPYSGGVVECWLVWVASGFSPQYFDAQAFFGVSERHPVPSLGSRVELFGFFHGVDCLDFKQGVPAPWSAVRHAYVVHVGGVEVLLLLAFGSGAFVAE